MSRNSCCNYIRPNPNIVPENEVGLEHHTLPLLEISPNSARRSAPPPPERATVFPMGGVAK